MLFKRTWNTYPNHYQTREIKLIAHWIVAGQSGAVVGPPGTGKSNLFGFLNHRIEVLRSYLPEDRTRIVMALVDLNNLPNHDLATIYRMILRALYESRTQLLAVEDPLIDVIATLYHKVAGETDPFISQSALREVLLAFETSDIRLVLILDPFDRLVQTVDTHILDNLRGLRDSFKLTLSYLVGMQRLLRYLRDPNEIGDLYSLLDTNICWLGGMSPEDARFVVKSVTGAMGRQINDGEIDQVIALTGGYATLLRAASLWIADRPSPPPPDQWIDKWLDQPSFQNRLQALWHSFTGEEQQILAELQGPYPQHVFERSQKEILLQLKVKRLCECVETRWQICNPLLAAYIRRMGLISTGKIHHRLEDDVILQGSRSLENQLTPQDRTLLLFFLYHPRKILEKDKIVEALWPESEIYGKERGVDDGRLQKAVSQLRQVLEKRTDAPQYIKTVPRVGYRFFPEGAPKRNEAED